MRIARPIHNKIHQRVASAVTRGQGASGSSPIALVASTIKAGAANSATTDAVNTTGANLLVVSASWYNAVTATPTVTDSKSNTWTRLTIRTSGDQSAAIWYSVPTSVGSGHTVTVAGSTTFMAASFSAYSGADASPFVQEGVSIITGTSSQLEIDPDSPNALVVTAINTVTNGSAVSINESFTGQYVPYNAGVSIAHAQAYKILSGQSVTSPSWSWTGASVSIAVYAVFAQANQTKRTTVAITSPHAFFSPYGWYSDGSGSLQSTNVKSDATYAITANPGNYIKTKFTGTSLRINVDVASLRTQGLTDVRYPALEMSIDGGAWTRKQLSKASDSMIIASGLSAGEHTVQIVFVGTYATGTGRFTTPTNALKITGFRVDSGAALSAPTLQSNRAILYGDSISEGYDVTAATGLVADQNARLAWPFLIGELLGAEFGVVGFASQGYTVAVSEIPDLEDAWDFYSNAKSRLVTSALSPACDYIISGHGTNDSDGSAVQAAVESLITQWRAAAATAKIFVLTPPGQGLKANLSAAVTASADGAAYFIDTGINYFATSANANGGHLSVVGQAAFAADSFAEMEPDI